MEIFAFCVITIEKNKGFPNGPGFRYGNFFIPRVVKNHKMSPREEKAYLPRAVWNSNFCPVVSNKMIVKLFTESDTKLRVYESL